MITFFNEEHFEELNTSQRRSLIVDAIKRTDILKVSELSQLFGVTMVTIRRDLDILEKNGKLKRIHGGAVSVDPYDKSKLFGSQDHETELIKERIGQAAAELISKSDKIIIDSGSTPLRVVNNISYNLLNNGSLTIITNSLPVCHSLRFEKGVNLIILGGLYLADYQLVVGPRTIDHLKTLNADKVFLGTDGLTFSQGVTTANVLEAEVSQEMVKVANQVIVVSDSSKIGQKGLASMVPLTEIHMLITDRNAPDDFVKQLREYGVEVILV